MDALRRRRRPHLNRLRAGPLMMNRRRRREQRNMGLWEDGLRFFLWVKPPQGQKVFLAYKEAWPISPFASWPMALGSLPICVFIDAQNKNKKTFTKKKLPIYLIFLLLSKKMI